LDIADLDLTLRDYCEEFGKSTGLRIEYVSADIPDLPEEAELGFFRFLQEALTNIVKHAKASFVHVRLEHNEQAISLIVADNGIGQSLRAHAGQGHLGMRERFRILNGRIQIEAREEGRGFKITASIPLPANVVDEFIRR
jgi:two-component system sensor histidine kinase UhpB